MRMTIANRGLCQAALLDGEPQLDVQVLGYVFKFQSISIRLVADVEIAQIRRER